MAPMPLPNDDADISATHTPQQPNSAFPPSENGPEVMPNAFSLPEFINNKNDVEEHNNPPLNPLPYFINRKDEEDVKNDSKNAAKGTFKPANGNSNAPKPELAIDSSKNEAVNNAESKEDDKSEPEKSKLANNTVGSPTHSKKYKLKTPTTPAFKSFFNSDKMDSPGGNGSSFSRSPHNNTHTPYNSPEGDVNWLKRFSKFNGDSATNEWRNNFSFFKKQPPQKPVKKAQKPKKHKLSESDAATRARANYLIDSLFLGYTASNLVSSVFLLDEQDNRRAPLLAHLVGIKIVDITDTSYHSNAPVQTQNGGHAVSPTIDTVSSLSVHKDHKSMSYKRRKFKFELEYGVGDQRAKWTIIKSYKEVFNFSLRLKLLYSGALNLKKGMKLVVPNFPKLKEHHGVLEYTDGESISDQEATEVIDLENGLGSHPDYKEWSKNLNRDERRPESPRSMSRENQLTRISSGGSIGSQLHGIMSRISNMSLREKKKKVNFSQEEYCQVLEAYFKRLFFELSLRPQSNKLFQFFELSPIGVLLSNENGYKGKQGYLLIATSAKKQGWRVGHLKASDLEAMIKRHTNKWFCIRESYILYVSDINSTTILDVFLVDEKFTLKYNGEHKDGDIAEIISDSEDEDQIMAEDRPNKKGAPHLNITVENKERKLKMVAKSAHEMNHWVRSIQLMTSKTEWSQPKRFDSFAPIRQNCFAKWFVDARDYWWAASSAIEMAKDVIFIHDWWLSPELYLRRPANGNQEWRIDRLLKRKAEQGVKIFIIIYRNIGEFVVIDSSWTKHSLMELHENIRVLRSPNQFLQNTFFWAHHEKLLIIDHTVAFLGGIDLCYGRYDTPDHVLADDAPSAFADPANKSNRYQVFPGKDYSNPRVKDFFELSKPYESMYDRQTTPRMPWHDVHMVNAGQIARDLSRHFVQRWNYLIRQKRPSRPTPLLTPPTNFTAKEAEELGLQGTCEVQLLRSSGYWSLGLKEVEHSIQNAYLKLIETSEHFVYLENQFFVTACAWDNVVIENRIGDALVDRIIRAHKDGTVWRAVIVIPLMPGFEAQVDEPEGSSVRIIMQCQYMSISRGSTSIFAKLRKVGIDPDNYIQFFSLRKWGRIGDNRKLVSEQLYIHAKTMMIDDRIAIIGSANINERSMRGSRDSEVCAVVRDTETVDSTMNGKPYKAGKFAHTLRMRLMREHLGIDVDSLELVERRFTEIEQQIEHDPDDHVTGVFNDFNAAKRNAMVELASREVLGTKGGTHKWKRFRESLKQPQEDGLYSSFNHRAWVENLGLREKKSYSTDPRIKNNKEHKEDVEGKGVDQLDSANYGKWKLNAKKIIKKWANEASDSERFNSVFIPNMDSLREFLDNDDEVIANSSLSSADQESILAQRDRQRWEMLKRVAYLQMVAVKAEKQLKEENARRVKAGLEPKKNPFSSTSNSVDGSEMDGEVGATSRAIDTDLRSSTSPEEKDSDNPMSRPGRANSESHSESQIPSADANKFITITNLNDSEVDNLLEDELKIGHSKFIDPYGFSDPLDEEFYDDIWFENAYRNTKLFRSVFHCQPDNLVATWKEYKDSAKLMKAFSIAQDHEMKSRNSESMNGDKLPTQEEKDEEHEKPPLKRYPTSLSIRLEDLDSDDVGVLGMPPSREDSGLSELGDGAQSALLSPQQQQQQQQRLQRIKSKSLKKFSNLRKGPIGDIQGIPEVDESGNEIEEQSLRETIKVDGEGEDENNKSDKSSNKSPSKSSIFHDQSTFMSPSKLSYSTPVRGGLIGRNRNGTFTRRHKPFYDRDMIFDQETADKILSQITGHLVLFPVNWLHKELESNNWFTNSDRLPPIDIYD